MPETTKEFGPIAGDYAFFQAHSTEAAEDVAGYAATLARYPFPDGPIQMLDFGCGDGQFSAQLHTAVALDPDRLYLTLVEPVAEYRVQAITRLQPFTHHPITVWPTLPAEFTHSFQFILSNHALYYVPNLSDTVTRLLAALAAPGLFLTALAGTENQLLRFWNLGYGLLQRPVPYSTGNDLQDWLQQQNQPYEQLARHYELTFPDSRENRLKIIRFLMGQDYDHRLQAPLLAEFEPFTNAGQIKMPIRHEHYIVRK